MARVLGFMFSCVVLVSCTGAAQTPARFEVASVKPSGPDSDRGPFGTGYSRVNPDGSVRFSGQELIFILAIAYEVDASSVDQRFIAGAQRRFLSERFDIEAKGGEGPVTEKLKTLLVERFQLRTHMEVREIPLYALTMKEPGTLGRWLKAVEVNCIDFRRQGGLPENLPAPCLPLRERRYGVAVAHYAGTIAEMIARVIPQVEGRPVIDRTGLKGNFEWEVAFDGSRRVSPEIPNLFTALEDQLGLKLEATKGPYEVIVIDHVQMPTPN